MLPPFNIVKKLSTIRSIIEGKINHEVKLKLKIKNVEKTKKSEKIILKDNSIFFKCFFTNQLKTNPLKINIAITEKLII